MDGAKSAGELSGRVMVVCGAQRYAEQLFLARSQPRGSALRASRRDAARKAFERVTKKGRPVSHKDLARAGERREHAHTKRRAELEAATAAERQQRDAGVDEDVQEPVDDELRGEEDLED